MIVVKTRYISSGFSHSGMSKYHQACRGHFRSLLLHIGFMKTTPVFKNKRKAPVSVMDISHQVSGFTSRLRIIHIGMQSIRYTDGNIKTIVHNFITLSSSSCNLLKYQLSNHMYTRKKVLNKADKIIKRFETK